MANYSIHIHTASTDSHPTYAFCADFSKKLQADICWERTISTLHHFKIMSDFPSAITKVQFFSMGILEKSYDV